MRALTSSLILVAGMATAIAWPQAARAELRAVIRTQVPAPLEAEVIIGPRYRPIEPPPQVVVVRERRVVEQPEQCDERAPGTVHDWDDRNERFARGRHRGWWHHHERPERVIYVREGGRVFERYER